MKLLQTRNPYVPLRGYQIAQTSGGGEKKISLNHSPYDEKKPAIKPTGEKTESVLVLQQVQPSPGPGDYMKQVGD